MVGRLNITKILQLRRNETKKKLRLDFIGFMILLRNFLAFTTVMAVPKPRLTPPQYK